MSLSQSTTEKPAVVMHDGDTKFTTSFDKVLKAGNVTVQKSAYRSPNTVAIVERLIQTLHHDCLDHFVVFGEQHLNHLVCEMVAHYHEERPPQAKGNELLTRCPADRRRRNRRGGKPLRRHRTSCRSEASSAGDGWAGC